MITLVRLSVALVLILIVAACSQPSSPSKVVLESQAVTEKQKLSSSDAWYFGTSVAVDGDLMVVGATRVIEPNFDGAAIYLYQKDVTGTWTFVKKLLASDGVAWDNFGGSVAISGNTVVVGASSAAIGANYYQGAAYIFERDQGGPNAWGQVKKLVSSLGTRDDHFGTSVAISGDIVVVGVPSDTISGNRYQGSAYLFNRNTGGANNWGQFRRLLASDGAKADRFGTSVAISGSTIIIGAFYHAYQGAAYLYQRDQGGVNVWGEVKKLGVDEVPSGIFYFGSSVAINGNFVVVGAPRGDGTNIDQGSAYLFARDQGGVNNWGVVKKLLASDGASTDSFGSSVAISGNTVVIGAEENDIGSSYSQGSAYLYKRNAGGTNNWGQARILLASDGAANNFFGNSVAISGNTIVVGAVGNPGDSNKGAAYIY
jgi:FG-GAP repeat